MQISDVEDLTAIADRKAHKLAENLVPENVRHEVEVKSNSLKEKWAKFKERNPQAQLITSFFAAILTFSLFFLDLFTDINAINSIRGANPTKQQELWGYIMLVFLLLPFIVSMVGILVYVYKKFGISRSIMLVPFLPFIQVLLDFTLPFIQLAGRCNLLNEDIYAFSIKTEAESALILSITISLLSIIWHILGTFLASKAMGVTYREYLITLAKMGGGLPLEPVRRNRIRVVHIDFTPDIKQFQMLMGLLASEKQSSVEEIDLSYSDGFKVDAMKVFSQYISSNDQDSENNENKFTVKTFTYQYNNKVSVETLNELGNGLKTNTSFESLYMGQNNLYNVERLQFLDFLSVNKTLKELHLNDNNLNSNGARVIAKALEANKCLHLLNLERNLIDNDGMKALFGNMLSKNSTLKSLLLCSNKITSGEYIANGLKVNKGLTNLDLSKNNLKDNGIISIASSLSQNNVLETINLSDNDCGEGGSKALALSLCNNVALKSLTIIECNLPILDLRGKDENAALDIQLDKQGIGYYDSIIISKLLSGNEKTIKL
eukprot:g3575.t1